jgi:hypothetical protein
MRASLMNGLSNNNCFRNRWPAALALAGLCGSLVGGLFAHPISQSSVAVDVLTNKVVVEMNIMAEDYALYHGVEPGEDHRISAKDLREAAENHKEFLLKFFTIRDANGEKLPGKSIEMDATQVPEEGIFQAELMQYGVIYRFDYLTEEPQPFLTFSQNFGGDDSAMPSVMDLMVLQSGVWIEEPTKIGPKSPHSVNFDWANGPPEPPKNWRELRKRREARKAGKLGIGSYSGLYSYIYIEPFEVRHEVLIPMLTFEAWLPLERADKDFITIEEQEAARAGIEQFFREHNPVSIDGVVVQPVLQRLDFYGLDFRDFAQQAPKQKVSVYQARLGVILSYSVKGHPNHVKMSWDAFNQHVPFVKSVVYAYEAEAVNTYFEPIDPDFEWKSEVAREAPALASTPTPKPPRMIALPMVSLFFLALALIVFALSRKAGKFDFKGGVARCGVIAGIGALCWPLAQREIRDPFAKPAPPSSEAQSEIFAALHQNIYRAFDYKTESDVYDTLEQSIGGPLLSEIYLQIQKGLQMQEQGGAIARVREVKIVGAGDGTPEPAAALENGGFPYPCTWTVRGTVEHWGHIHTRENEYEAVFTVERLDSGWKITGLELRNEKRLKFETGIRGVEL